MKRRVSTRGCTAIVSLPMRQPGGIFLLVILGCPLLISVVARTLGRALLFGGDSCLVNKLLVGASRLFERRYAQVFG